MKLYGFLGFYFVLISNLFGCCCKSKKEVGMSAGQGSEKNSSVSNPKIEDKKIILPDQFANGVENIVNDFSDDVECISDFFKNGYNNFIKGFGKLVGKNLNNTAEGVKEEGLGEVNSDEFKDRSIDNLVECNNSYKKINDVNDDLLPIFQKILGDNEVISKESISEMMKNKDVICYSLSNSKNYLVFFCCKNDEYLEKIKKLRKINDGLFYVYVTINNVAEVNLSFYKIFEVNMMRTFFNK